MSGKPGVDLKLPEEVWLAGKGPSLDRFDWSKAGPCRIGINETVFVIPECWGAIAADYHILDIYLERLPPHVMVFRKETHIRYKFPNMYLWNYGREAIVRATTAPAAVQVFQYLGAKAIHFVGFDSVNGDAGFAQKIKDIKAEGASMDGYKRINMFLMEAIEKCGVEAIWEHRN